MNFAQLDEMMIFAKKRPRAAAKKREQDVSDSEPFPIRKIAGTTELRMNKMTLGSYQ